MCAGIAPRHSSLRASLPGMRLGSEVVVMSGSGSVFKRCRCRVGGTSRRLGSGCPRLRSRGHGSWYFSLESDQGLDSRCRVRRGGFASREAARAALRRTRGDEPGAAGAVWTVGGWLQQWLDGRTRLRARTRVGYAEHIDRYLNPYLGGVPLEELTPALVRQAFERISCHTTPRGALLSAATVQRVRATLRAALNTVVRERLLASNPAKGLRLDNGGSARPVVWTDQAVAEWRHGGDRPAVAVWTVEQTRAFLDFVSGHRLYALFHLVVMTGLRRGEVVGLRWEDVDLARGTVGVVRQLQSHPGQGMVESEPKSAASRRTLMLDHTTLGVLRRHRHGQQTQAAERGLDWDPQGYVFTAVRGGPMAPERLSRLFRTLNTKSGLPPVRFHDLRHGAATLALAAGVELKVVQAMLGHASIVLTADTYAGVLPEVAREAAERTAWLVLRDAGKIRRQVGGRGGRRGLVLASPRSHPGPTGRKVRPGHSSVRL